MTFAAAGEALLDELVALRRAIHADPEVGLELPRTQRRVLEALEGLPLEIALGRTTTSVTAVLRGTVESSGHVRTFQRGQITVSITTVDGYDPTTYRALPVDYDLAADLAERIDADIEELQDH